jgi:FKBP-type peptidyl-prolyl cis-trans isomerase
MSSLNQKIGVMMKRMAVIVFCLCFSMPILGWSAENEQDKKLVEEKIVKEKKEEELPGKREDQEEVLKSFPDRVSYSLGMDSALYLKKNYPDLNLALFIHGLESTFRGEETLLTSQESAKVKKEFIELRRKEYSKKMEEIAAKNKKEGEDFLVQNKNKEGVITTDSGLQYIIIKEGEGNNPQDGDKVKVNYRGTLLDGTEFDSSYKRGEPAVFPLNGVIPGWTEALKLLKVGGRYRLFIPSDLAYGVRGAAPRIGPNALLIFEVELLGIEK